MPATLPPAGEAARSPEKGASPVDAEYFNCRLERIVSRVDAIEENVDEVDRFFVEKKEKPLGNEKPRAKVRIDLDANLDVNSKDGRISKGMQELMRQFGTELHKISKHKWAGPFMEPVDVEGLQLHDYNKIIKKPMDLGTIMKRMEAKDSNGYKNVREIYADVRLVFTNAMTYNDKTSPYHKMARAFLDKFEEKWLKLLPNVIEEEGRQNEEKGPAEASRQFAREAAIMKLAKDANNELDELTLHLEKLREMAAQKCRKISGDDLRKLAIGLSCLSTQGCIKALEIVADEDPSIQDSLEVLDLDLDKQSVTTLWKLKFFLKEALGEQQLEDFTSKVANYSRCKSEVNGCPKRKEIGDASKRAAKEIGGPPTKKPKKEIGDAPNKTP